MVSHQQLITQQQFGIVYIHRLTTPKHFSILSPRIRQPFSMFCNVTATFPHDRGTFGSQFRNCRHSFASHSATSDRFRRLNRNLSYVTPLHTRRIGMMAKFAHLLINDTESSQNQQHCIGNPSVKHRGCSGRQG